MRRTRSVASIRRRGILADAEQRNAAAYQVTPDEFRQWVSFIMRHVTSGNFSQKGGITFFKFVLEEVEDVYRFTCKLSPPNPTRLDLVGEAIHQEILGVGPWLRRSEFFRATHSRFDQRSGHELRDRVYQLLQLVIRSAPPSYRF